MIMTRDTKQMLGKSMANFAARSSRRVCLQAKQKKTTTYFIFSNSRVVVLDLELELAIDPKTGMKNYIANGGIRLSTGKPIKTAKGYISEKLRLTIEAGRRYQ